MRTVLIVDDDPDIRLLVRLTLGQGPVAFDVVAEAGNGTEALERWRAMGPPPVPHLIVLDNSMPDRTGLEIAREILAEVPEQPIVLFSAFLDAATRAEAEAVGVARCIDKEIVDQLPEILAGLIPDPAA